MNFARLAGFGILAVLLCTGCQYKVGSLAHPDLKAISIAQVENTTREPGADTYLKMRLPGEFMTDGTVSVVPADQGQATLYVKITDVDWESRGAELNDDSGEDSERTYITTIYGVDVEAEYWVMSPKYDDPIVGPIKVNNRLAFSAEYDHLSIRQHALRTAMDDLAVKIVRGVTEAW